MTGDAAGQHESWRQTRLSISSPGIHPRDQTARIGSGSRIGIVSFASTATANTQLITSVDTLKNAVDALVGRRQHQPCRCFHTGNAICLIPNSSNAKVIVMFTDGNTTTGAPPAPVADAAKAQGIIIYCIGLIGSDGLDVDCP